MFDVGFTELALLGVLGLLVLGPERLPRVARTIGLYLRKARGAWYNLKSSIEQELAAEDLKRSIGEVRQESESLSRDLDDLIHPGSGTKAAASKPAKAEDTGSAEQPSSAEEPPRHAPD